MILYNIMQYHTISCNAIFQIISCHLPGLCSNAAMDRWHDLKLPRGAYLNFMPETLLDGLAYNRLVQI